MELSAHTETIEHRSISEYGSDVVERAMQSLNEINTDIPVTQNTDNTTVEEETVLWDNTTNDTVVCVIGDERTDEGNVSLDTTSVHFHVDLSNNGGDIDISQSSYVSVNRAFENDSSVVTITDDVILNPIKPTNSALIKELPTYTSLSTTFLNDEPPKYEVVTGEKLKDELNEPPLDTDTPNANTRAEDLRRSQCLRKTVFVFLFFVIVAVLVTVFTAGRSMGENSARNTPSVILDPSQSNVGH